MQSEVEAIHRGREEAILSTGEVVPIIAWFDILGNICEAGEAVTCAAGADGVGWWSIDLSEFEPKVIH